MNALASAVARWTNPDTRPLFKGSLIDRGTGCMCAQGDVLFNEGGYTATQLNNLDQGRADRETAKLLGISVAHSILLRKVNDRSDGQPQNVLSDPGSVLGKHHVQLLSFWLHMDSLDKQGWQSVAHAADAADAAYADASAYAASAYASAAPAAYDARRSARYAVMEIIGQTKMRDRGNPFVFLKRFGFDTPDAIPALYKVVSL